MKLRLLTILPFLLAMGHTAQAEPLKVKPGLWEMTTATEKKNANKPTNLDKLTPEQREKVEKKLAEQVKKETKTAQSCLKDEQIQSGEAFTGKSHQASCTHTFLSRTATEQIATLTCTGANPMTGTVEIHAADPEQMTGKIEITYGAGDKLQLLTRSDITARWLGSDCGKVASNNPRRH
jgi:hypothetical protein